MRSMGNAFRASKLLDKSLVRDQDEIYPLFTFSEITQLIGSSVGIVFEWVRWQEQRAPTAFFLLNSISGSLCPARVGLTSAESQTAGSERAAVRLPRGRRDARRALRTVARHGILLRFQSDLLRQWCALSPVVRTHRSGQAIHTHVPLGWV